MKSNVIQSIFKSSYLLIITVEIEEFRKENINFNEMGEMKKFDLPIENQ